MFNKILFLILIFSSAQALSLETFTSTAKNKKGDFTYSEKHQVEFVNGLVKKISTQYLSKEGKFLLTLRVPLQPIPIYQIANSLIQELIILKLQNLKEIASLSQLAEKEEVIKPSLRN